MLQSSNIVGKIIINNLLSKLKNLTSPLMTRTFHFMSSKIPPPTSSLITNSLNVLCIGEIGVTKLLKPTNSIFLQVAGFKVKGRLRRRCKDCYYVMRQERLYVICKTHPRHKQMSMKARDYKSWILTHATQSKIRPY